MIYVFKHPDKEKYIEVSQGINEDHVFFDEDGLGWDRVYTSPSVTIKENIDPFNSKQFAETTAKKRGTVGDIADASRELSEERKRITGGEDPVQKKYFEDYSKKRKGKKHPNDPSIKRTFGGGAISIE